MDKVDFVVASVASDISKAAEVMTHLNWNILSDIAAHILVGLGFIIMLI